MAILQLTTILLRQLQGERYRLFVGQNFTFNQKKILLIPFRETNKAIAYLKTLPGYMNGQIYHELCVLEEVAEGIAFISYYVQMPDA